MTVEKPLRGVRTAAGVRPPSPATALGGTILLADDDLCLLHGIARGLRKRGATVIATSTGHEAMQIYRRRRGEVDAVILDLCMPGMDGEDLYAMLRHLDPTLPLLVHSAEYRQGFEAVVAADPRASFERKPCRFSDLVGALSLLRAT